VAAAGVQEDDDEELDDDIPSRSYAAHNFGAHNFGGYGGPTDFQYNNRSYDDEDEALQAALRASMEDVPDGYVMPELAPIHPPPPPRVSPPQEAAAPVAVPEPPSPTPVRSESREDSIIEDTDDDEPAHEPSPGELACQPPCFTFLTCRGAPSRSLGAFPVMPLVGRW
jgi:ataxin-3